MKFLFGIIFLFCSCSAQTTSGFDKAEIFKSIASTVELLMEYEISGYNRNLSSEQVIKLYCPKPSDKVFRPVYFNDPQMATKLNMTKPIGLVIQDWSDNGNATWITQLEQISGRTGFIFGGKIGRITALDPAVPFTLNVSTDNRLDRIYAVFLSVVHSNNWVAGGSGLIPLILGELIQIKPKVIFTSSGPEWINPK